MMVQVSKPIYSTHSFQVSRRESLLGPSQVKGPLLVQLFVFEMSNLSEQKQNDWPLLKTLPLISSQLTLPPSRVLKSILYVCIFIPILPLPNEKQIASGKKPHSTGRSARCFVTTQRGGIGRVGGREMQEGGDMGIYVYV